jgi:LysM repeat protein
VPQSITGTVEPVGLNLRHGPGIDHDVIAVLLHGQTVTVTARSGNWLRVESPLGAGFVSARFITLPPEADPPEVPGDETLGPPEDRAGGDVSPRLYTVRPGDTIRAIAARLGVAWRDLVAANGIADPNLIRVNQVLRIPGAAQRVGTLRVLDPLPSGGGAVLTSSSANGHHTPYGGTHSADLDVSTGKSPGQDVRFAVDCAGRELRGVVHVVGFACRSAKVDDGGLKVQLRIEQRAGPQDDWASTGAWVLYAHLDPVAVNVDDKVKPGHVIGQLGRAGGQEYQSPCAGGSHVHLEATRGSSVANVGTSPGNGAVMTLAI